MRTSRRLPRRPPGNTTTAVRCVSRARGAVEHSIREPFLEAFNRFTDAHVLGDSRDPATTISPLIHPDHLARVEGFVERARGAGDRILRGGKRFRPDGLWYQPT